MLLSLNTTRKTHNSELIKTCFWEKAHTLKINEPRHDPVSNFKNHSFIGSGQGVHMPPLAIILFGHDTQNLRFLLGTLPSGQLLHESSNNIIWSALHCKQEYLSPLGNDPSGQV